MEKCPGCDGKGFTAKHVHLRITLIGQVCAEAFISCEACNGTGRADVAFSAAWGAWCREAAKAEEKAKKEGRSLDHA